MSVDSYRLTFLVAGNPNKSSKAFKVNMLIYDVEIENAVLSHGEEYIPGVKYCAGWYDFSGMGISCICAYDYKTMQYRVFCQDNINIFQKLIDEHDIIVGFNNHNFDDKLCLANGIIIPEVKSYDILKQIWLGAGLGTEYEYNRHRGYSLNAVLKANISGAGKSGIGANAPIDWQNGKIGTVIDYCIADVWNTKLLLDLIISTGELRDPKTLNTIQVCGP
ncbi:MAG: hypothetical protein KGZ62_10260 [Sulfurimonas sp.]|nr:hypothetical protein [Sulfurimonas sp.]